MFLLLTGLHGMTWVVNHIPKKSEEFDLNNLPLETNIDDDDDVEEEKKELWKTTP